MQEKFSPLKAVILIGLMLGPASAVSLILKVNREVDLFDIDAGPGTLLFSLLGWWSLIWVPLGIALDQLFGAQAVQLALAVNLVLSTVAAFKINQLERSIESLCSC